MPTKSASRIITRDSSWLGPAIPPGEILLEEFLKPLGIGQADAARRLGVSLNRLNEIILGKRGISADTALRLARAPENLSAVLDAVASGLGLAPGHGTRVLARRRSASAALNDSALDPKNLAQTRRIPGQRLVAMSIAQRRPKPRIIFLARGSSVSLQRCH